MDWWDIFFPPKGGSSSTPPTPSPPAPTKTRKQHRPETTRRPRKSSTKSRTRTRKGSHASKSSDEPASSTVAAPVSATRTRTKTKTKSISAVEPVPAPATSSSDEIVPTATNPSPTESTSTPTSEATSVGDRKNSSLSTGQAAGAAIGTILGIFVIAALLAWAFRKYKKKRTEDRSDGSPGFSDWRGVTPIGIIRSASTRMGLGPSNSPHDWNGNEKYALPEDQHAILGQHPGSPDPVLIGRPSFVNGRRDDGGSGGRWTPNSYSGSARSPQHDNHGGMAPMGMGGRHGDEDYDDGMAYYQGAVPIHISSATASKAPSFEVMQARDQYSSPSLHFAQSGAALHQRNSSLAKGQNRYDDDEYTYAAPRQPMMVASSPTSTSAPVRYRYDPMASGADDVSANPALSGIGQHSTLRNGQARDAHDSYLGMSGMTRPAEDQRRRMEEEQAMQVAAAAPASLRVAKSNGHSSPSTSTRDISAPEMSSLPPVFPAKTSVFDPYTHISRIYEPSIADDIRRALDDPPSSSSHTAHDGPTKRNTSATDSTSDDYRSMEIPTFINELSKATPPPSAQHEYGSQGVLDAQPEFGEIYDAQDIEDIGTESEDDRDLNGNGYAGAAPRTSVGAAHGIGTMLANSTLGENNDGGEYSDSEDGDDRQSSPSQSSGQYPAFQITAAPAKQQQPSQATVLGPPAPAWRAGAIAAAGVRRNRGSNTTPLPTPPGKDCANPIELLREGNNTAFSNGSAGSSVDSFSPKVAGPDSLAPSPAPGAASGDSRLGTRSPAALAAVAKLQARQQTRQHGVGSPVHPRTGERWEDEHDEDAEVGRGYGSSVSDNSNLPWA